MYVSKSGTAVVGTAPAVGILYWDLAAWNTPASTIGAPTGSFATTRPDGSAWGTASPYGITTTDDDKVCAYSFGDKKIACYNGDGTGGFIISTGAADLVSNQQARFLHSTGSFAAGTLRFYIVGATSTATSAVWRIAQTGGAGVNAFAETQLFLEQNDGATNYAATATPDGNTVYVSSSGNGPTTNGLRKYTFDGVTWSAVPTTTFARVGETIHDINMTANGAGIVVSIPGTRAMRVYDAVTGLNTGGVNYGTNGQALASGGVAVYGDLLAVAMGYNGTNNSWLDVLDAATPLPVELVSFTGVAAGTTARLAWATASETNNAGFAIERQTGAAWTQVGYVDGHGTTAERNAYAYDVAGLVPGRHSFRLRQVDLDGATHYSATVEVAVVADGDGVAVVGANPFAGRTSVAVAVRTPQTVRVELYDALGRRVATPFAGRVEGTQTVTVDGAGLPAGLYVVRVAGERFSATRTLTKAD